MLQTLREAKDLADARAKEEEAFVESRKSNFGAQFDDFQGFSTFWMRITLFEN